MSYALVLYRTRTLYALLNHAAQSPRLGKRSVSGTKTADGVCIVFIATNLASVKRLGLQYYMDDFAESAQIPSAQPSPNALVVWAAIFSAMDLPPEFGLCFATVEIDEDVHVFQVHRDTRVGDTLCCLDQCYLPVVIRGLFPSKIVGEACVGRKPDGQWYSGDEYLASRDEETMEASTFE
ncbi:hypothetical protein F5Y08DRAFT_337620 [Xylaria arbuscula]|nr:hypothetical protein F5Y08DRAFT_337620 [Xylaria arbuscula]